MVTTIPIISRKVGAYSIGQAEHRQLAPAWPQDHVNRQRTNGELGSEKDSKFKGAHLIISFGTRGSQVQILPLRPALRLQQISLPDSFKISFGWGHLYEGQRHDAEAIQAVVLGLFHTAMDEMRNDWWYRVRLPVTLGS